MRKAIFGSLLTLILVAAIVTAQATGIILLPGSNTLKSLHFQGYPGLGIYMPTPGTVYIGGTSGGVTFTETGGSIPRAAMTEDALQAYGVSVFSLRQTTGIPIVPAEVQGNFNLLLSANVYTAQGEVTDNESETSVTMFQIILPDNYVAGGDVKIRLPVAIIKTAAATDNASSIDISAYEQTQGAVGADICATAAQVFAAVDTWYNKDFVITATDLVAGDTLNVVITSIIVDSEAGAGTLRLNLDTPKVLLDVKG